MKSLMLLGALVSASLLWTQTAHAEFYQDVGITNLQSSDGWIAAGDVAWGDYDNDGDLDLAVMTSTGGGAEQTLIYQNNGDNSYADINAGLPAYSYGSLEWGDFDNDNDLDLLVTGEVGGAPKTAVYQNDNGVFTDISALLYNVKHGNATWADYDNDNDLDIVLTGTSDNSSAPVTRIYRNDDGTFFDLLYAEPAVSLTPLASGRVAWGDYDNDGDSDIVLVGGSAGAAEIYRNDGNDTFTNINASLPPYYGHAIYKKTHVAWGDYDNDNDLDLVISGKLVSNNSEHTAIYRNDSGTFTDISATLPDRDSDIKWGDIDNDGDLDLISTHVSLLSIADSKTQIFRNDNGTFSEIYDGIVDMSGAMDTGDFDGDGYLDLVITGQQALGYSPRYVTRIYRNMRIAENTSANLPALSTAAGDWGDYDGDGDLDLLLAGYDSSTYSNYAGVMRNDNGVFNDIGATIVAGSDPGMKWGDYDNDGDLDFVIAGSSGTKVYRNDNGSFVDIGAGLTGLTAALFDWGDYDNDGDLDLLAAGISGSYLSTIYRNDNGSFTDIGATLTGVGLYGKVAWGDFDGDGDLDILLSGSSGSGVGITRVYQNNGGSFTEFQTLVAHGLSTAAWGDYDGDGDLDVAQMGRIVNTGPENEFHLFKYDGSSFVEVSTSIPGLYAGNITWGDFDNDGALDLIVAGQTDDSARKTALYRNLGSDTFVEVTDLGLLDGAYLGALQWGDYDQDGDLDLLVAATFNGEGNKVKLFENGSKKINTAPSVPTNLATTVNGSAMTFSWDASSDSETPAAGLTYNLRVGTTPGGNEILTAMAAGDGSRLVAESGNVGPNTSWTIDGITNQVYWSVQAVDNSFSPSAFAAEETDPSLDATPPTLDTFDLQGGSPTNATSVSFNLVFSEDVSGVDAGDFNVSFPGGTTGTPILSGSGTNYTLTVPSIVGDGTLQVSLKSSGTGITDGAANAIDGTPPSGSVLIDQTAPVITLNGAATIQLAVGETWSDPGATATDNLDASVSVVVGGDTVSTASAGAFTITYNATDSVGNAATEVQRHVTVLQVFIGVINVDFYNSQKPSTMNGTSYAAGVSPASYTGSTWSAFSDQTAGTVHNHLPNSGGVASSVSLTFPEATDSWYGNDPFPIINGYLHAGGGGTRSAVLGGLDPAKVYDLYVVGRDTKFILGSTTNTTSTAWIPDFNTMGEYWTKFSGLTGSNTYTLSFTGNVGSEGNLAALQLVEIPDTDADDDGLPDEWELRYFLNPTNAVAGADSDGDGQSNFEEYIAGMDPTNSTSFFAASLSITNPTGFVVNWSAVTGRTYSVYWNNELTNGFPSATVSNLVYPQNSWTDTVHAAETKSFYRMGVQLSE